MEEIEKEKTVLNSPLPVTIECTKIILNQLMNFICKIENRKGNGTGFFCSINDKLKVLITNNHIINEEIIKRNQSIRVSLNDDKDFKIITLKNKKYYTNETYDITIIEINPEKENITNFLELEEEKIDISKDNPKSVYILQYPSINLFQQKAAVSYGIIRDIEEEYNIIHYCCTEHGSSGSPILNLLNNKLIGIHKENIKTKNYNRGTLLKYPIKEYLQQNFPNFLINPIEPKICEKNEINLALKIEKKDINKKIYFLNNDNDIFNKEVEYEDSIEYYNKLLNESIIEIFINDKKYDNKKYLQPKREGLYEIKLKFSINIANTSYMFYGCTNLTKIDLSFFETDNVINMSYMFYDCSNLAKIDLFSLKIKNVINMSYMFYNCYNLEKIGLFFNTKNVINMSCMFCNCSNLKEINFSSLDTINANNMMSMFCNCSKLVNINLSSVDTKNVSNMSSLFFHCSNLIKIDLSSFDTKNAISMNDLFSGCSKLTTIDLSSFDTKNVSNMNGIFSGCSKLTTIDLSSFDTKNVTDMNDIIFGCSNLKKIKINNNINSNDRLIKELSSHNIKIIDILGNNIKY